MSFEKLDRDELYRSAIEDFAVEVEEGANKKVILAALLESGVEWQDYVDQHPAAEELTDPDDALKAAAAAGVIKSSNVAKPVEAGLGQAEPDRRSPEQIAADEAARVVVQAPLAQTQQKYLIKMDRENVLFQTRGHTFTQSNPYALMDAEDAQWVIDNEDGFRLAGPAELQEYYS